MNPGPLYIILIISVRGPSLYVRIRGAFYYHSRSEIAHLHMRIVKIKRLGQSARLLPILYMLKRETNEESQRAFIIYVYVVGIRSREV